MRFNLALPADTHKATMYLAELIEKQSLVEVKKISPKRSLSQNAYLHLTFGIFGLETGYEAAESKVIYKREANPQIYVYEKNGQKFMRSSADLTIKEMTDSIDKWRKYAAEHGVYIPAPGDDEKLRYWGNEIERSGKYL